MCNICHGLPGCPVCSEPKYIDCPVCYGDGYYYDEEEPDGITGCQYCNGEGSVPIDNGWD